MLFLLLGAHGFVSPSALFLAPASHTEGACPLNLDPENGRLNASPLVRTLQTQAGTLRGHVVFSGVSVALSMAVPSAVLGFVRPQAALPDGIFVPVAAPPPPLPGYDGLAAFALPPPLA